MSCRRLGAAIATPLATTAILGLSFTAAGQEPAPIAPSVDVRVDPRVELMSIIFRLAGNPEYRQGKVDSYTAAVDAHFASMADHAVVQGARALRYRRGVSFDAVMSLAVHLTDADKLGESVPFQPRPAALDARWRPEEARAFLKEARRFVEDAEFAAFFEQHRGLYDTAVARMQRVLREEAQLDWFAQFFGARPTARFELALGMLNGGACYGPRVVRGDGQEDLYCVLGVWKTDPDGLPFFETSMLSTVVHEFCHSYCNRLVDAHYDELQAAADKLYPHVADQMKAQAYGNARTMMYESLVRACVVRYLQTAEGRSASRKQAADDGQRGFLWVDQLAELLTEYEEHRDDYPTVDSFMPKIAAFFDGYADSFEAVQSAAPTIVSMTPANGATTVDPATTAIVVTFDRPMLDRAWSVVGGGPALPKTTGAPSYDEECRVLTLPVELEPDWSYEFWLNRGKFQSFQSADRVRLQPVHVQFKTGPAK